MSAADLAGWVAAALTLMTFVSGDMRRLRAIAIGANVAFICYGLAASLWPVLALHLLLAPVNIWRLRQLRGAAAVDPAPADGARRPPDGVLHGARGTARPGDHPHCGRRPLAPRPHRGLSPMRRRNGLAV